MKKLTSLLLAVFMLLSLCACGAQSKASSVTEPAAVQGAPMESAMYDSAENGFGSFEASAEESGERSTGDSSTAIDPEKIIYSGSATIETTDFDSTLTRLMELVSSVGGFVESSSQSSGSYYQSSRGNGSRSADYTLRVPSSHFNSLMSNFSALGHVPYSYVSSENVSASYYDAQARLTAYETQEQRLLEMLAVAETVEEIIIIEDRLAGLRYDIESLQSQLNNWDRRIAYSTISLSVQEVKEYTPEVAPNYWQRLGRTFVSALKGTGEFFMDFLVFLVGALPAIVIIGVLYIVFRPLIKKQREKRRAEKERVREQIMQSRQQN